MATRQRQTLVMFQVISIAISVGLQDLPFLVLRMLLIFRYDVLSYTNIFFTCKNSLVLVLQVHICLPAFLPVCLNVFSSACKST